MWNIAVLAVMLAVAGAYATRSLQTGDRLQHQAVISLAREMAMYREAVIRYFEIYDIHDASVSYATLTASGALPGWTRMAQGTSSAIWNNYRDAAGIIYIYASSLPAQNIVGELVGVSHQSILVGTYQATASTLQSPLFGDTNIPLSALTGKSVPDGAPVWIAMTK